jgi:hypothetical protein
MINTRTIFSLILIFTITIGFAQTRRIAHRAHHGAKTERYDDNDGSYGKVMPRKVKVHLESGRDTMVYEWDSIANPNYRYWELDTVPQQNNRKPGTNTKENIRQMGKVAGRMTM